MDETMNQIIDKATEEIKDFCLTKNLRLLEKKRELQLRYLENDFLEQAKNTNENKFEIFFDNVDCLRIADIVAFCEEHNFNFYAQNEENITITKK